jgi:hypothetical protein
VILSTSARFTASGCVMVDRAASWSRRVRRAPAMPASISCDNGGRKLVTIADEHSARRRVVAKSGRASARIMIALSGNENDGKLLLHDDIGSLSG